MLDETRRNVWVGLFVLAGVGALGALVLLFGQAPTTFFQGRTYEIKAHFDQVADIRPGNLVTARGITIGRVSSVDLRDPSRFDAGVEVSLAIDKRYRIPTGSSALTTEKVIGQGRPPIEILPGPADAVALEDGATIQGKVRGGLESLFPGAVVQSLETAAVQIGSAAEALTPVLREMETLMRQRSPAVVDAGAEQGNVSSAVARLDASLKHFNEVLGDPTVKSQLRETVSNLYEMTERGKKVMGDVEAAATDGKALMSDMKNLVARADTSLQNIDQRVNEIGRGTTDALGKASNFFDELHTVSKPVTSGEGNLGRLFMDARLYDSLLITTDRMAMAIEELRLLIAEWRQGRVKIAL